MAEDCQGFFNVLKAGSVVENLTLNNVKIKAPNGMMLGAAVGYIPKDDNSKETIIRNVTVKGKIEMEGYANIGVILGRSEAGSGRVIIDGCKVEAEEGSYIRTLCDTNTNFNGGIVGALYGNADNLVKNCEVKNLSIEGHCAAIGGIAGFIEKGRVEGCKVSNCTLIDDTDPNVDIMSMVAVGAIAGTFDSSSTPVNRKNLHHTLGISGCETENVKIKIADWIAATKTLEGRTGYNLEIYNLGVDSIAEGKLGPAWDCWSVIGTNRWLDQLDPMKDDTLTYVTIDDVESLKSGISVENL